MWSYQGSYSYPTSLQKIFRFVKILILRFRLYWILCWKFKWSQTTIEVCYTYMLHKGSCLLYFVNFWCCIYFVLTLSTHTVNLRYVISYDVSGMKICPVRFLCWLDCALPWEVIFVFSAECTAHLRKFLCVYVFTFWGYYVVHQLQGLASSLGNLWFSSRGSVWSPCYVLYSFHFTIFIWNILTFCISSLWD